MLEAKTLDFPASGGIVLAPFRAIFSVHALSGATKRLQGALGLALPPPGKRITLNGVSWLWSGPDSWLAMAHDEGRETFLLNSVAGLAAVTNQSDGKTIFLAGGSDMRDVLAKLIQIDLHETAFLADDTALTLAGHIPVQIWREEQNFALACFRSFAGALHHALCQAQMPGRG